MNTSSTFGTTLHSLRTFAHLTQREAAKKIPCDFTFLSKIENDKETPSWDMLKAMLKVYKEPVTKEWAHLHLMATKKEQFTLATL